VIEIEVTDTFDRWLKNLRDLRAKERIFERVRRLRDGNVDDVRPIGRGLSELRIDVGPGYRLYFARRGKRLVILLCGDDKSSQREDIARAIAMVKGNDR